MAGGAGLGSVPRQPRVVEQVPSELHARRRHRRVCRHPRRRHPRRQVPPILAPLPLTRKRCDRQRHHRHETDRRLSLHMSTSSGCPRTAGPLTTAAGSRPAPDRSAPAAPCSPIVAPSGYGSGRAGQPRGHRCSTAGRLATPWAQELHEQGRAPSSASWLRRASGPVSPASRARPANERPGCWRATGGPPSAAAAARRAPSWRRTWPHSPRHLPPTATPRPRRRVRRGRPEARPARRGDRGPALHGGDAVAAR